MNEVVHAEKVYLDHLGNPRFRVTSKATYPAIKRECWYCGIIFWGRADLPNGNPKFCSRKCSTKQVAKARSRGGRVIRRCVICKSPFRGPRSRRSVKTCGTSECKHLLRQRVGREMYPHGFGKNKK